MPRKKKPDSEDKVLASIDDEENDEAEEETEKETESGDEDDDDPEDSWSDLVKKNEEYERTLCSIYNNVKRICDDGYLRHCILSEIEAVYPEVKEKICEDQP